MGGPARMSGRIDIAKNEDWAVLFNYVINFTVSGSPENLVPKDITGHTFKFQMRKIEADNTAVVTASLGDGIEITNAAGGEFVITLRREKLYRLHAGNYSADLIVTDPAGYAERVFECGCTVVEGTTR
jgi:hypothetical protein